MNLHFEERGTTQADGIALVFLHYFGGAGREWRGVMERLAPDFHCIAPDLRGSGDSPAADSHNANFGVGVMADDIAELITELGLTRYVLVGHSMGGKVALEYASRQPAGLLTLALVAPSPPTPEPMVEAERQKSLAEHPDERAAEQTLNHITFRPLPPLLFLAAVEDNLRTQPGAWRAWLETGSRENIAAKMAQIAVPAGIIVGEHDPVIAPALAQREVADRLPGTRLTVVPKAGHLLPLETPEAVSDFVRNLVRSLAPVNRGAPLA